MASYNFNASGKISPLVALTALVLVISVGFAVYSGFKSSSVDTDIQLTGSKVQDLKAKNQELESQGVASALSASELVAQIDKEYLQWSQVIQRIQNVVPKSSKNEAKVEFLTYSGGRDGKITLTTKTLADSKDAYQDTADVLRAFNGSEYFASAFIPGINKTVLEDGSEVLSYVLQMNFVPEAKSTNSNQ